MSLFWAAVLLPLQFAVTSGSPGTIPAGSTGGSPDPVRAAAGDRLPLVAASDAGSSLDVPIVVQVRERCGQAALEMVLRYYGADSTAVREADRAYDPILHGSLITDLAAAAQRAGYEASVITLTPDSLVALLGGGVPAIVLYQAGRAPFTTPHYGVVTRWDLANHSFTLNDGGARPHVMRRSDLAKRWQTAGSQALIVHRRS
jgi:ABC-type bacteriocin/lantibiotic exporter with double-glycine peptidase domain